MTDLKKCVAEGLGVFFFCFVGISTVLVVERESWDEPGGLLIIALAHGLAICCAIMITYRISGAHLNPAVTTCMLVTRRIELPLAGKYIVSQLLGATFAAFCVKVIFEGTGAVANLAIPLPGEAFAQPTTIILVEAILTLLMVLTIFGTVVSSPGNGASFGAIAIGMAVTFDGLAGGTVTGASMNPARSFGPALIHGDFQFHWCYWVGPIAGAIVAALFYDKWLLDKKGSGG